jgi:phosphoglycolate phosphatase-like HAD superfamily hydrolase
MDITIIKKIIFDVDGVLLNTFTHHIAELMAVARAFGIDKPAMERIKKHWGKGLEEFLEKILPSIPLETFLQRSIELGFRKTAPPRIPGVRRTLFLLAKYYSLSIVSNRSEPSLMAFMRGAEINIGLFRFIQTASHLPRELHKPNPKVFSKIISILLAEGIKLEEIMYIGDNEIDFWAANGAGINFVGVTTGGLTTRDDFLRIGVPEEYILDSIRDLPRFLGISEEE